MLLLQYGGLTHIMKKNKEDVLEKGHLKRCLIVGAGVAGRELLEHLLSRPSLGFKVAGFVDDNPKKQGKQIKKVPIIGKTENLEELIKEYAINNVFIAIPSAQGSLIRSIINSCQKAKVSFRIVPRTLEIVRGKVNFESVRPLQVEDLLGRAILKAEQGLIRKLIYGSRVLITGAAGSIGSELVKQISQFNPNLLLMFDWWENGLFELDQELYRKGITVKRKLIIGNIQDKNKIEWVFKNFKPQTVFHAAAFKHVPLMEEHAEEAIKNNILGTYICAENAGKYNTERFVLISSDKAVNPSSVMGATKSFAELIIRYLNKNYSTKYSAVRFGNVLGSHGSVVPLFQKQIAAGGPVTVTHPKMVRYFMTIPEAVQLILHAARLGKGGEIFVLDMGEQVKIIELAKTMIRLAGFEPNREISIKIIGKRPGEKIFEEVLTKEEKKGKTEHERIYVTRNVLKIKDKDLLKSLEELVSLVDKNDRGGIIKKLESILPSYRRLD